MNTSAPSWIIAGITGLIAILFGVAWFFLVLVMLNGFSTSEGTPMLAAAVALILVNIVLSAGLSQWLAALVQRRMEWSPWVAGSLGILAATVLGAILVILCSVASIVVLAPR